MISETVWEKPKEGCLPLAEFNRISEQAKHLQEVHAEQESKFMVQNADEMVAKYNREKLKQRRVQADESKRQYQEDTGFKVNGNIYTAPAEPTSIIPSSNSTNSSSSSSTFISSYATPPTPYGQWQTVVPK